MGAGTALLTESLDLCRRASVTTYHAHLSDSAPSAAMHRRAEPS